MSKKLYTYKARQNALLSIQLYKGSSDSLDLRVVANLPEHIQWLFPDSDFDAERHGKFAAEFVKQHANGRDLRWIKWFVDNLNKSLNGEEPTRKDTHDKAD